MCAIVDANVRHEVFGDNQSEAGKFFLDWLLKGNGAKLVVGGKLWEELVSHRGVHLVFADLLRRSKMVKYDDSLVNDEVASVNNVCQSNDAHILALARVSGARLLFTNDQALQGDFGNPGIINDPRGRVYTTRQRSDVTRAHRSLLNRTDLCAR